MAFIGQNLPDCLIRSIRVNLDLRVLANPRLLCVLEATRLHLSRGAYLGDYVLQGWSPSRAYYGVAKFGMLPLPGCFSICHFYHSEVVPEWRGKGIGKELLLARIAAARDAGFKMAMATVRQDNSIEHHLLEDTGWLLKHSYLGNKGAAVDLFMRTL